MCLYAVVNDIHLGHLKTPTTHIINSFKQCVLTEKNKNLDIIFIAGDLFDRLLDLNSKEVHCIIEFFNCLLTYCQVNDIMLRVLHGTSSHDNDQAEILVKLNEIKEHKCDLKYHKVLDIEYIEKYNKYVLYIPDEWANTHEEIEAQIQNKLNALSIFKVDIAILHGQFKYQLAGKKYNGFYYKEEYFLNLVKGFIHIGHYHVFSKLDRIIATGSLDRLAHGEEFPKGYVLVNNNTYTFVENTNAYTYVTLNITNSTTLDKLDKMITKYPINSYIRLLMNKNSQYNINFNELKLRYMDYNIKKLIKENVSEAGSLTYIINDDVELFDDFTVDSDIYSLLLQSIKNKYSLSNIETNKLLSYIEAFNKTTTQ